MDPQGRFMLVNLGDTELIQAKFVNMWLHTHAHCSYFWIAFKPILEFWLQHRNKGLVDRVKFNIPWACKWLYEMTKKPSTER